MDVSYTHLDVYKRQLEYLDEAIGEHIPARFKQSGDNYEYMTKDCCHDH